jgi:acetyltransferase-like isoleucine patch superfamily enzyme
MLYQHELGEFWVVGSGILAQEYSFLLERESTVTAVHHIEYDELHRVPQGGSCVLAFGNIDRRKRFLESNDIDRVNWPIYVHPAAWVEEPENLQRGTWIYGQVYVCFRVRLGEFNVISTHSSITHETHTGRNVYFSPNVTVGGRSSIGHNVFVGYSSTISSYVNVTDDVKFMMGSLVHKDVVSPGTYYGNRAVPGATQI